jgi:hypothetical protein
LLTVKYDDLMSGIDIKALIKRECNGIIIEGPIGRRVVFFDASLGEAGNKFLNPANALDTCDGRTKCTSVPGKEV